MGREEQTSETPARTGVHETMEVHEWKNKTCFASTRVFSRALTVSVAQSQKNLTNFVERSSQRAPANTDTLRSWKRAREVALWARALDPQALLQGAKGSACTACTARRSQKGARTARGLLQNDIAANSLNEMCRLADGAHKRTMYRQHQLSPFTIHRSPHVA